MSRKIYIEYREGDVLAVAHSVELGSADESYGIKELDGTVVVADGTSVENPSTGIYEYSYSFENDITYRVSWRIIANVGDNPQYITQEIGPFRDSAETIRAVAEYRGKFSPNSTATVFLKISELNGLPHDATDIEVVILNGDGDTVKTGVPERGDVGFYAFDWGIPYNQAGGAYTVRWSYTIDGVVRTELQSIVVSDTADQSLLYSGRTAEFRANLIHMIHHTQFIPVYNEQAKVSHDRRTFAFSFGRWNQSPGCKIYRNGVVVTGGVTVDYANGKITFDESLTEYDQVNADYNFRWFSDEELDRFLSNAIHMLNMFPPVTRRSLYNVEDNYIPIILYGAVVDALRYMMLSLKFQEPQLVFGGADAASKMSSELESLKKNYEETWNKLLEQKKFGPYKGLTRMITTPAFNLPGGRSRWFRYLFSGGGG